MLTPAKHREEIAAQCRAGKHTSGRGGRYAKQRGLADNLVLKKHHQLYLLVHHPRANSPRVDVALRHVRQAEVRAWTETPSWPPNLVPLKRIKTKTP